jgi:hypothetical protein
MTPTSYIVLAYAGAAAIFLAYALRLWRLSRRRRAE